MGWRGVDGVRVQEFRDAEVRRPGAVGVFLAAVDAVHILLVVEVCPIDRELVECVKYGV